MRSALRVLALPAFLALATLGATQASAGAAMTHAPTAAPHVRTEAWPYGCPFGATCAYPGTNFTGGAGPVYGNNTNDRQYSKWANAESILNHGTQCTDWIYYNENYRNPSFQIPLGYQNQNLAGSWGWHHLWSNHWCNQG